MNREIQLCEWYDKKVVYPLKDSNLQKDGRHNRVVLLYNDRTNLYLIDKTKIEFGKYIESIVNKTGCIVHHLISIELEADNDESADFIHSHLTTFFADKHELGNWYHLTVRDVIQIQQLFWQIYGGWIWDDIKETAAFFRSPLARLQS